jgi:hypothetical protein
MLQIPRVLMTFPLLGLLFVAGCGGQKTVTVAGKLVLPANVKLADNDSVSIAFVNDDKPGLNAHSVFTPGDSSFECKTAVSNVKYKVVVTLQPYMGTPDKEKRAGSLEAVNKKFGRDGSTLFYETTQDAQQKITIDLTAGTVTKN